MSSSHMTPKPTPKEEDQRGRLLMDIDTGIYSDLSSLDIRFKVEHPSYEFRILFWPNNPS